MRPTAVITLALPLSLILVARLVATEAERITGGLVVLYDFANTDGTLVPDRSGIGKPLNLRIHYPNGARSSPQGVELIHNSKMVAVSSAAKLSRAIQRSGEMTVEAWIKPTNATQAGPARILTLSSDVSHRNFTLGQDQDKIDMRLRTTKTSGNGLPSLTSKAKTVGQELCHVVFTRDRRGQARIYLNGKLNVEKKIEGNLSNWDRAYKLCLGDELSGGRAWKGIYRLVAIYHRSLSATEVETNFRLGPGATSVESEADPAEDLFALQVAPLLAEHCLECHDAATKQGGLDLSHKAAAFAGGASGPVIAPGEANASRLWETVLSDEMPLDRSPLSATEKQLLQEWINAGAGWTMDFVDPVLYAHGGGKVEHWVQRLTVAEYIAAVQAAVGVDISDEARALLPPDRRADGFSNTAYNLNVDFGHVEAYAKLAEIIVGRIDMKTFAKRFAKTQRFTDKDMGALIESMGKWILRGPLDEKEVIALRGISTTVASSGGSFEDAASLIVEAMLQSPRFIYRLENQVGDGTAWPTGEFELASRLSFIVWGAPPDKQLYRAAEAGELFDPAEFDKQIERMFADPRALTRAKQFVAEWLDLQGLNNLQPNPARFSQWQGRLVDAMREETLAFFEHVAWFENRPLSDLLSAQVTFVSPELARHYNLQVGSAADGNADQLQRYDLSGDPVRGGLLTQGSVLTKGGDDASMVTRGLFVLHNLLRGVVKDPPPCVDTTPVPTKPGVTQRTIALARLQNEACGGCHSKFEPLAFGLEKFDGLGTYHERDEHGNALRDDGEVLFPGDAEPVPFQDTKELMRLLASSARVQQSLTWKVTQFALGRPLTAADAPLVDAIHRAAEADGGSYRSVVKAIVKSDLVQMSSTELPTTE